MINLGPYNRESYFAKAILENNAIDTETATAPPYPRAKSVFVKVLLTFRLP